MALQQFRKIQVGDRVVNQLQQNVAEALQPLHTNPILSSNFIPNVSLAPGSVDITVNHGLGRSPRSYFVGNLSDNTVVYTSPTPNPNPEEYVILRSSSSNQCTCDLYVF